MTHFYEETNHLTAHVVEAVVALAITWMAVQAATLKFSNRSEPPVLTTLIETSAP